MNYVKCLGVIIDGSLSWGPHVEYVKKTLSSNLGMLNTIRNCVPQSSDQFNFLGITLDKHLNWNAHTNKLFGKISRNTGILNKIKLFLLSRILKNIYSSLILCQLNYGILVWGQNYKRIVKLQKRVMRIIACSKYNAQSEPLFKELNLLKLEDIRKLQELKFYYKLVHRPIPSYFNCICYNYKCRSST